jgi:DNA-binding transcriptional ArsR family regulator
MSEIELLKEISGKLSQLIVLTKLARSKEISDFKEEIKKDKVVQAILVLSDGSLSSSQLKEKVIEEIKVSKATIERRIADLIEKGALILNRQGKEIYYQNSGLYD